MHVTQLERQVVSSSSKKHFFEGPIFSFDGSETVLDENPMPVYSVNHLFCISLCHTPATDKNVCMLCVGVV